MSAISFCPNCGTRVEGDIRFCPTCGTAIPSETAAAPSSGPPQIPPPFAQQPAPPPRKGFPGGQSALIGVVLVVVALIAGIVIVSSSGGGDERSAPGGPVATATTPPPSDTTVSPTVPVSPTATATLAPTPSATAPANPGLTLGPTCSNDAYGYQVAYPQGWYTSGNGDLKCQYFDPEAFVLAPDTEVVGIAVTILPAYEKYQPTVGGFIDPAFASVIAVEETTVGGRRATRLESKATGNGFYEKGTLTYGYVVNLGGYGFSIVTSGMPGPDYETNKAAVDLMAGSLSFYA